MLRDLLDEIMTTRHTERKTQKEITGFRQNTEVSVWAEIREKQTGKVSGELGKLSLELQILKVQLTVCHWFNRCQQRQS